MEGFSKLENKSLMNRSERYIGFIALISLLTYQIYMSNVHQMFVQPAGIPY